MKVSHESSTGLGSSRSRNILPYSSSRKIVHAKGCTMFESLEAVDLLWV